MYSSPSLDIAEKAFLGFGIDRRKGIVRRDRVRNIAAREELRVEELLLRVERSQLRWYDHVHIGPDKIQNFAQKRLGIDPVNLPEVTEDRKAWSANRVVRSPLSQQG